MAQISFLPPFFARACAEIKIENFIKCKEGKSLLCQCLDISARHVFNSLLSVWKCGQT